jgi:PAS domain S-box-containing protein
MIPEEGRWFDGCFQALSQFTAILDSGGRILTANRAALDLTGLTLERVYQVPLWEVPWPALTRQNRLDLKRAVSQAAQGKGIRKEIHLRRGSVGIFDFSIKPIHRTIHEPIQNGEGGPESLILAEGRDITAYRRASEALFQSEARFQTIFEETGMGIVIKGVHGRMLDANPAFQDLVGYTAAELRRLDYLDITHPLDKKASRKLFNELVTGARKNYVVEKRYNTKDGQTIWGRVTASLVRGPDGGGKFVIGMVENITAQKQIAAELIELQQHLMAAREMERLKVAQDLHDGPLQEIIGISYQVQEGLDDGFQGDAGQEKLREIRASITSLTGLIRAICGELRPPTLVPFGLEKTILSHVAEFQKAHPDLDISYKLAHDGHTLPERDRIVLFRIYQESINNILRHAHAKAVKIRFRLTTRKAILEVQDDGVGFELPRRWVGLARQGHLGLVGAMERASEVGGDLTVITAPGQGTLIRATLPLKENTVKDEKMG